MSVIITGMLIRNLGKTSVALTEADGPQTFSEEYEARLVSEGVAKYVEDNLFNRVHKEPPSERATGEVATAVGDDNGQVTSDNLPDNETGSNDAGDAQGIPEYSTDMKVTELREILEECQIPFKVGMSKADMVAALDAYFEDEADDDTPPALGAEDPIV